MKNVYVPSIDTLYKMQDIIGGDKLYNYILVKAIETLIIKKASNKSILEGTTKKIREDYDISSSIGYIYPEEIKYSQTARYNNILASSLLDKSASRKIYNLDYLTNFEESSICLRNILEKVIKILDEELINSPEYRFEYKSNILLDSIFNVDVNFLTDIAYSKPLMYSLTRLINIEPSYGILLPDEYFYNHSELVGKLIRGIDSYSKIYHVEPSTGRDYYGKDILTNQDEKTKRLIKIINKR